MVKTQVFQSIKTREDWRLSQAYRRYSRMADAGESSLAKNTRKHS